MKKDNAFLPASMIATVGIQYSAFDCSFSIIKEPTYQQSRIQLRRCFYRGHSGSGSRLVDPLTTCLGQTSWERTQVGDHFHHQEPYKPRQIVLDA